MSWIAVTAAIVAFFVGWLVGWCTRVAIERTNRNHPSVD